VDRMKDLTRNPVQGSTRDLAPNPSRDPSLSSARDPIMQAVNLFVVKSGRKILDIPEIEVRKGEVLAIIGPNGAGKSTLLATLACLEFPKKGKVLFKGREVNGKNALSVRRQMAVVFQEPLLLDATVLENVRMGLALRGRGSGSSEKAVRWLRRFGIDHLSHQMAHTLSGGEAQRASLARAFALEPEVLFLDEPFASLDSITRGDLMSELRSILDEYGTTTLLVTHDFREVQALSDRVLVLDSGTIQAEGTPEEIARHPVWQKLAIVTVSA